MPPWKYVTGENTPSSRGILVYSAQENLSLGLGRVVMRSKIVTRLVGVFGANGHTYPFGVAIFTCGRNLVKS